jgi:sugar lactone lactonase YvrE
MSDDYISGLRADLIAAAGRYERRGTVGRAARPLHPRAWHPAAAAGALALTAAAAAVVIALGALAPPLQRVGHLDVVATVPLGGQPADAAYGGGFLWVADYEGQVLRVDPVSREVREIAVPGKPAGIAAGDSVVWVLSEPARSGQSFRRIGLDPRTGRIVYSQLDHATEPALAAGAGAFWTLLDWSDSAAIGRIGPSGAITGGIVVAGGPSLAAGRDSVWVLAGDGTLTEVDAATGDVISTIAHAVSGNNYDMPENAVAADALGAWAVDTHEGDVVHVVAGRVVKRISVAARTRVIARSADAVWVATTDASLRHNGLARIDPERGVVTATADLGYHVTKAIVPVGDAVWAVASDGTATIVRDG